MSVLQMVSVRPWAPHPAAAPQTAATEGGFTIAANGTRTCSGGWQCLFTGVVPGQTYRIRTTVRFADIACARDMLQCVALWGDFAPEAPPVGAPWDFLLPQSHEPGTLTFARDLVAPAGVTALTVRCGLRWAAEGNTTWSLPTMEPAPGAVTPRPPVDVCVVTGHVYSRRRAFDTVQDNVAFYAELCEAACQGPADLLVLPEIALQWGVPGHALDRAVPVDGPETEAFRAIARRHHAHILLGLLERDGDAVYNSAILLGPEGGTVGIYRKVHLAAGEEMQSGILPGDGFPVFDTPLGRIGCNICMDTSAAESSRMVGLNGADFLLLPIMGDHRADRWNPGTPIFHEGRWKAIHRVHAMDNQLCLVAARNTATGSCIINRRGDILAWNEGDEDFIRATVTLDDDYRKWNGGSVRDVNWLQRRPHLYGAHTDEGNLGSLR